ncbi:MAG: ferrous iron transport protein B [Endozoicomonadaceae bacterium]|nr:ferrous iron transport protein B [Endozoicomonadaceae bacterium]
MDAPLTVSLVGNPNCGKTTLFNLLTGQNSQTGNWSGVTVALEKKPYIDPHLNLHVVDLPGLYSLNTTTESAALDEMLVREYILSDVKCIINVIDASAIARHLYLTSQLIDRQVPMIMVLNMIDLAEAQGIKIDIDALSQRLGMPIIPFCGTNKHHIGLSYIHKALTDYQHQTLPCPRPCIYSSDIEQAIHTCQLALETMKTVSLPVSRYMTIRALESRKPQYPEAISSSLVEMKKKIDQASHETIPFALTSMRYRWVCNMIDKTIVQEKKIAKTMTQQIDSIVLNTYLGLPIFFAVMYALFSIVMTVGQLFQPAIEQLVQAVCVNGVSHCLLQLHMPSAGIAIFASIGQGLSIVVSFVPLIAILFFCLAALEASGYIARASFLVDKIMRKIDLPGQAFVPFIVGFGCNVPAILATRTLPNERDRKLSILMNPFMSCSARLQVFSLLTAVFFTQGSQNIVFLMYLIGIAAALFTGLIMRKTLLTQVSNNLLLELPAYHCPTWSLLFDKMCYKVKYFLIRTGKTIVILVAIIQGLSYFSFTLDEQQKPESILVFISKKLTPALAPLGIIPENWPATLGILTGILAKETVVAVLNSSYDNLSKVSVEQDLSNELPFNLWLEVKAALLTIPEQLNLKVMSRELLNEKDANDTLLSSSAKQMMQSLFTSQTSVLAYLMFILLYIPCVSTMGAIRREIGSKWMYFSIFWTTFLAYMVSVCFYQLSLFCVHPLTSSCWVFGLLFLMVLCIIGLRYIASRMDAQDYRPVIIQD